MIACLLAALSLGPVDVGGWLDTQVESAHVSIGRIKNAYPVYNIDVGMKLDGHDFGYILLDFWTECDLGNRNRAVHDWYFHEMDPKIGYGYRFHLADGFVFDTSVAAQWNYMSGYYGPSRRSYDEWQIAESLETPWLTAYYSMRNFYWPVAKASYRFGFYRSFPIVDGLSFVPHIFCEGGGHRWNSQRFRQHADWTVSRTINSVQLQMFLNYKLSEWLSLYGGVTGYFVVDSDIRRELRRGTGRANQNELAILTLGAKLTF